MQCLDLFFPRQVKCVTCGFETNRFGICDECIKMLEFIKSPVCEICGGSASNNSSVCLDCKDSIHFYDKGYMVFNYSGDVRMKIIALKQNGVKAVGEMFAHFMRDKFDEILSNHNIDVVIPVPISNERIKERKYNQSEVLCSELLDTNKVDVSILKRIKDTPHQTGLSRDNRIKNLIASFEISDKSLIKDKDVLIVDDIYTTGSTVDAISKILKLAGAKSVMVLCLARAVLKLDKIIRE